MTTLRDDLQVEVKRFADRLLDHAAHHISAATGNAYCRGMVQALHLVQKLIDQQPPSECGRLLRQQVERIEIAFPSEENSG